MIVALSWTFLLAGCSNASVQQDRRQHELTATIDRYELYPTENMWTFLKLDTADGRVWQVQYAVKDDNRGEVVLNGTALVPPDSQENGRFVLYPTRNLFTFILLDSQTGLMWQVQWSLEDDRRLIVPLNHAQGMI